MMNMYYVLSIMYYVYEFLWSKNSSLRALER